ncbi:MAG: M16 family metallopeptidase [Candidatus Aminicenantia bacterium]
MKIVEHIANLLETVHSDTLENGLKYIIIEKHALPLVSFYTFYRVGSRNEMPGKRGISHFLEHLMFNETKKLLPREFDRVLEENGGDSNAYTSQDWTVYFEEFPPDALDKVIEIESDRMQNLVFTVESVESERWVVTEERRFRTDNLPYGIMEEALYSLAYLEHPYRYPIIGYIEDISNIKIEDLENYYKNYYVPNNSLLVISGDVEKQEVFKLIERNYGNIPSRKINKENILKEKGIIGEKRGKIVHDVEVPSIMISYLCVEAENNNSIPLDILLIILAGGRSSRLYKTLVHDSLHAISVSAEFQWRLDPSLFTIHCILKKNENIEVVEEKVYSEIEKLKNGDLKEEEIEKAKNIIFTEFIRGMQTNGELAHLLGTYEMLFGNYKKILDVIKEYEKVNKSTLIETTREYITEKKRTVLSMVPINYKVKNEGNY